MNTIKRITTLVLLLVAVLTVNAQELTVKSMEEAPFDRTASMNPVLDFNNNPCGLVKVRLAVAGAKFGGNIIEPVKYDLGEYSVYMTEGSHLLNVRGPGFVPLMLDFRDYGIHHVAARCTYVLTLLLPSGTSAPVDDGMRYLVINVKPTTATVFVDDEIRTVLNGSASVLLPKGVHSYRVEAAGYSPKSETVEIGDEKKTIDVVLESALAQLTVNCPTTGAKVYVNGNMTGTAPWTGQVAAGNYQIEARLDGYRPQQQSIALGQKERRTVELPVLTAIVGAMNVNYQPVNAEVWLDGKKLGTSPDVFRNILVGSHSVEVRASGYQTDKKTVTISEGQTAQVSGQLDASPQPSPNREGAQTDLWADAYATTGNTVIDNLIRNMVYVEGGTFTMGATSEQGKDAYDNEFPTHKVTLSSFRIGKYEVTQREWKTVMGDNPSDFKGNVLPVETVSWNDCQEFIRKLNSMTGMNFRLPTEAEWEYAARGGNKSRGYKYSGSNDINIVAWYDGNSGNKTHPVGTKSPNELGLYDMSGNVWEWCQDWYDKNYYSETKSYNPVGPSWGSYRVDRGGAWSYFYKCCRVSHRGNNSPDDRYSSLGRLNYLGLRLAL